MNCSNQSFIDSRRRRRPPTAITGYIACPIHTYIKDITCLLGVVVVWKQPLLVLLLYISCVVDETRAGFLYYVLMSNQNDGGSIIQVELEIEKRDDTSKYFPFF